MLSPRNVLLFDKYITNVLLFWQINRTARFYSYDEEIAESCSVKAFCAVVIN